MQETNEPLDQYHEQELRKSNVIFRDSSQFRNNLQNKY